VKGPAGISAIGLSSGGLGVAVGWGVSVGPPDSAGVASGAGVSVGAGVAVGRGDGVGGGGTGVSVGSSLILATVGSGVGDGVAPPPQPATISTPTSDIISQGNDVRFIYVSPQ